MSSATAFEQALIVASNEQTAQTGSSSATAAMLGTAATATGTMMTAAGFTSSGVAAGSAAAAIQKAIGNVASSTLFSGLQSFGALGGFATMGIVGLGMVAFSFFLDMF